MQVVRVRPPTALLVPLIVFSSACNWPPGSTTSGPSAGSGTTVTQPAVERTLAISPSDNFTIPLGGVDTVVAMVNGDTAAAVTYASSSPGVVTVSATGVITAIASGTATIFATSASGVTSLRSDVDVTVLPAGVGVMTPREHGLMVHAMMGEVCPNQDESFLVDSLVASDVRVIHEFHDCQRLIQHNAYQSVVGIYAHRNLTDFPWPFAYVGGRLAAIIVNFETKGDTATYTPLGLAPGMSCLVMRWTPVPLPSGTWHAAIVHTSSPTLPAEECHDGMNWSHVPLPQTTPLEVKPQQNAAAPNNGPFAPPVARWDWDSINGVNYMGVRCGDRGWCEIGPQKFTPRAALKTPNGKNMFKGYYDEQFLADATGALSDVFGTLSPGSHAINPGILKRDHGWYEAAHIDIKSPGLGSTAYAFYKSRLALQSATTQAGKVRSTGVMTMMSPPLPPVPTKADFDWEFKVNNQIVAPGKKLTYRAHPKEGRTRFANVRWRWNPDDETVWSFCPEVGCCEMGRL